MDNTNNEIKSENLNNVAGGYIYFNEETGMYEIINDKTWETERSIRDKKTAWAYNLAKGYSPNYASKSVVELCRNQLNNSRIQSNGETL